MNVFGLLLSAAMLVGAVSRDEVARHVETDHPLMQLCYEHLLIAEPELEGRAIVRFTIEPDGSVRDVGITGPAARPALVACLGDLVAQWRFASQPSSTTVELPVRFRARRSPVDAAPRNDGPSAHVVLALIAVLAVALIVLLIRIASTDGEDRSPPDRTAE